MIRVLRSALPSLPSLALLAVGCGGGATAVVVEEPVASASPLLIGGQVSNFGQVGLDTGFLPDPHQVAVVSEASDATGNVVDINSLSLTPSNSGNCRGFTTAQPDYIVRVSNPGQLLRFYVNAPATRRSSSTTARATGGARTTTAAT